MKHLHLTGFGGTLVVSVLWKIWYGLCLNTFLYMSTSPWLFPCCLSLFSLLLPNGSLVLFFQPTKLCAAQQAAGREACHLPTDTQQPAPLSCDHQQPWPKNLSPRRNGRTAPGLQPMVSSFLHYKPLRGQLSELAGQGDSVMDNQAASRSHH